MTVNDPRISYLLRQGDTPLILAQRLCAWCGHAPELEIDLALANIGLDLLGQARHFLGYAAELAGPPCSEDSPPSAATNASFITCCWRSSRTAVSTTRWCVSSCSMPTTYSCTRR